jgi:tetraacyldisaccharide 4'-kinase
MVIFAAKIRKIVPLTRFLLLPFSWLYGLITQLRNLFYDAGIFTSYSFEPAVICVGNLNVGGTGKSPMIEYLSRLLSEKWQVAILSRGYKRKTTGFRLASDVDNASTLGDEPFQFYKTMRGKVTIAVCADRAVGIRAILETNPSIQVILLDDAFQHRRVKPMFSILLTELANPFHKDFVLPAGRLREGRSGAKRADVIVVTKCGSSAELQAQVGNELSVYQKPVFFSKIHYKAPQSFHGHGQMGKEIVLVTGIANPKPLVDYLEKNYKIVRHFEFADHHSFQRTEIEMIQQEATASILTTEKDFVRLVSPENKSLLDESRWFYLPIESEFINTGSEFAVKVLAAVELHLKNKGH